MNTTSDPSPSTPPKTTRGDPARERHERQLRMLAELADIGLELARTVVEQAATSFSGDEVLTYSRLARAVRQTTALEAELDADWQTREQQDAAKPASRPAAPRDRMRGEKYHVKRLVEAAIKAQANARDAEALLLDLDERLDDPDIEAKLGRRPVSEIVATICRELGLTPSAGGRTNFLG